MNLRFWRRDPEQRNSFTDQVLAAQSSGWVTLSPKPLALAVVEACIGIIADPFLQATVSAPGVRITPGMMYDLARDVLTGGNGVRLIEVNAGSLDLLRPATFEIAGNSPSPRRWGYVLTMPSPDAESTIRAPYDALVHVRTATLASTPWAGRAPWQSAGLSADALAEIEQAIKDESRVGSGRLWVAPDGITELQARTMAARIRASRGSQAVVESMRSGQGRGAAAAPAKDWEPVATGQAHTPGNVAMHDTIEASISAAYGIPAAYLNLNATAPALTAVKRLAFLNRTMPLRNLIEAELTEKLERPVSITWPNLADQSVDVHLRARGAAALYQGDDPVTDKATALTLMGLPS